MRSPQTPTAQTPLIKEKSWMSPKTLPKVTIFPHHEDYCDTCAKYKISINAKQTTLNCLRQASNSEPDKIKKLEAELDGLQEGLESHRQTAQKSHQVYVEVMSRCVSDWKLIKELEEKTA